METNLIIEILDLLFRGILLIFFGYVIMFKPKKWKETKLSDVSIYDALVVVMLLLLLFT